MTNGDLKQIADRVKDLREIRGLSIESMAKECHVSPELCSKYESGESDIPVGFLYQVANLFHVELTTLITGSEPKLNMFSVVKKGQGLSVERRKEYQYQDLAYNFRNKKAETFLVTVDPKSDNKDSKGYSHNGQEFNYILEGSLKVNIQGHEIVLSEGDSIYFDSSYEHVMKAMNHKTARFLAIIIS